MCPIAKRAVQDDQGPEEAEDGAGRAHEARHAVGGGHPEVGDGPAEGAEEIEREEPGPAEKSLDIRPQHPQGEHVEKDVDNRAVEEGRGQEPPRLGVPEEVGEGQLLEDARGDLLRDPEDDANADQGHRHDGRGSPGPAAEDRARAGRGLRRGGDAVDALDADGGRTLALRAGRPRTTLTADIGHPVGMPGTDGGAGRTIRRARWVWCGLAHGRPPPKWVMPSLSAGLSRG